MGTVAYKNILAELRNPYVADGLVGWWDGIWNCGIGVHDSSSTVWKDLIGCIDLYSAQPSFSSNSAVFGSEKSVFQTTFSQQIADMFDFGDFTVEVCVGSMTKEVNGQSLWSFGFVDADNQGMYAKFNQGTNTSASFQINAKYIVGQNGCGKMNTTYACSIENDRAKFISGGNFLIGETNIVRDEISHRNDFLVGAYKYSANIQYVMQGNIHCVRIYSRGLSDSEMLLNYETDKMRFGI